MSCNILNFCDYRYISVSSKSTVFSAHDKDPLEYDWRCKKNRLPRGFHTQTVTTVVKVVRCGLFCDEIVREIPGYTNSPNINGPKIVLRPNFSIRFFSYLIYSRNSIELSQNKPHPRTPTTFGRVWVWKPSGARFLCKLNHIQSSRGKMGIR